MPFSDLGGSKKPDYKKIKLNQHNLGYPIFLILPLDPTFPIMQHDRMFYKTLPECRTPTSFSVSNAVFQLRLGKLVKRSCNLLSQNCCTAQHCSCRLTLYELTNPLQFEPVVLTSHTVFLRACVRYILCAHFRFLSSNEVVTDKQI